MSRPQQLRLPRRLLKHHLPLFAASVFAVTLLYITRPYRDVVTRASFATAYPALILLALTLVLGPWRRITKRRNPVSDDLRRDVGIWAGALGIVHSGVGQCVHLRGRPWLYYVYAAHPHHAFPLRHDLFGFANYTGVFGTMLLLALFATSNDYSLRAMGAQSWKRLQRWNYGVFALVALHAFGYHGIEKQKLPFVIVVAICVALTLTLQLIGFQNTRRARRTSFAGSEAGETEVTSRIAAVGVRDR